MMRTRMPNRVSHRATTKPVGPAPTMRTSVSFSVTETFLIQYGIQGARGLLCFRPQRWDTSPKRLHPKGYFGVRLGRRT
jgi:hypothetical protein